MNKVLQSFALVLGPALLLAHCAYLPCPSGQKPGENSCVCSSTLEPPVNGTCIADGCDPDGCPCTLEGIEAAIARGGMQTIKCGANAPPVDTTETIVIDNDVTLDGQSNCGPDSDQPCLTVQGDERHLMFDVQPFEVELIGFTITRGDQAIRVSTDATLTLTNSVVKENTSASAAGGGIFNNGILTLVGTTVERNIATVGSGGGIYNSPTGTLTLINSIVSNNVSEVGPGGGIRNDRGALVMSDSEVTANDAQAENGGGISNQDGTVTVTDSIIRENTTRSYGGAISTEGASGVFRITDSTVSDNRATGPKHAGGVWCHEGELHSTRSTWSGNTSVWDGGGLIIEGDGAVATLTSSTVSGNVAQNGIGGGILLFYKAFAQIINSTFYDNVSGAEQGGALHMRSSSTMDVKSSTFSNNGSVGIARFDGTMTFSQTIIDDSCVGNATTISMDYNIESPGDTCLLDGANDMVNVTPEALNLAEELADNGGDTLTLMLTRPSVAVDYLISTCDQSQDQRGVPRPQGLECDIGAVEIE